MSGEQNDFISQVNQAHNASEQNYQEAYEQNAQIKHEMVTSRWGVTGEVIQLYW